MTGGVPQKILPSFVTRSIHWQPPTRPGPLSSTTALAESPINPSLLSSSKQSESIVTCRKTYKRSSLQSLDRRSPSNILTRSKSADYFCSELWTDSTVGHRSTSPLSEAAQSEILEESKDSPNFTLIPHASPVCLEDSCPATVSSLTPQAESACNSELLDYQYTSQSGANLYGLSGRKKIVSFSSNTSLSLHLYHCSSTLSLSPLSSIVCTTYWYLRRILAYLSRRLSKFYLGEKITPFINGYLAALMGAPPHPPQMMPSIQSSSHGSAPGCLPPKNVIQSPSPPSSSMFFGTPALTGSPFSPLSPHMMHNSTSQSKRVRFRADVAQKLRPTASNLRPLGRLVKKEGGSVDQVTTALDRWDDLWRSYLKAYYDDKLLIQVPTSPTAFHEMVDTQNTLASLAQSCRRAFEIYVAAQRSEPYSPISCANEAIRKTKERRLMLLSCMVDHIIQWREVEVRYWASLDPLLDTHDLFCEYVEKIDNVQRKFKSLGDFERRLYRRAHKTPRNTTSQPNMSIAKSEVLPKSPMELKITPSTFTTIASRPPPSPKILSSM